jgi:enolase
MVPSGASTGKFEAVELRDGDSNRLDGLGCLKALSAVHDRIAPAILGMRIDDQASIDHRMVALDGTANKSRLGANAVLGVSLACAHAAAAARRLPLFEHIADLFQARREQCGIVASPCTPSMPLPMVNMISGGLHAGRNLDVQDFLIMPIGARHYTEALHWIVKVYRQLSGVLSKHGLEGTLVGDEGGFGPKLPSNRVALELVVEAIRNAGFEPGRDVGIAIDVASSHFFRDGRYRMAADQAERTAAEIVELLCDWTRMFPILSIEDGCAEDDWEGWQRLTEALGARVQVIGDDLFATNAARLRRGIAARVANSILVKLNQAGTLSETLEVIVLAHAAGYRTIVSARSGETEDVTIAHLAVGTAAGQIKIGSVARSERLAKYNELLRIEQHLGDRASLARFDRLGAS